MYFTDAGLVISDKNKVMKNHTKQVESYFSISKCTKKEMKIYKNEQKIQKHLKCPILKKVI
ncbi:MAG: hypothetical protein MSA26_08205 [Lachnospiraceae bacterium]|nr:hypothetical protein [Lachnospiraceae bacterium]